jgi:tetratricopeptide (TPR) repeat protein
MKISRVGSILLSVFFIGAMIFGATGCSMVNRVFARNELNDGVKAYKERKFDVAESRFKRSLELYPDQLITEKFLARALHQQYLANRTENAGKGEQAIQIYQKMLQQNPNDEETNRAVTNLLDLVKGQDAVTDWLKKRSTDPQVGPENRADALTLLASKQYNCANEITEDAEVKQNVMKETKSVYVFKKPADAAKFDQLKQCAEQGNSLIDQALQLDQNDDSTWSYKASMLVQQARIAEMENNTALKDQLMKQSDEAKAKFLALSEEKARKKEEAEAAKKAAEEANK